MAPLKRTIQIQRVGDKGQKTPGVLLATTREDLCADLLVSALTQRSAFFVRWNLEDFPQSSSLSWHPGNFSTTLTMGGRTWPHDSFQSAWFRRSPSLKFTMASAEHEDFARREATAALEGLLESSDWFWMNRPSRVRAAENKVVQLAVASRLGFCIPKTLVTNDPAAARMFLREFPRAVTKSLSTGATVVGGERWMMFTSPVLEKDLMPEEALKLSPCIFQEAVRKKADLRVTVVGREIFAARISGGDTDEVDWRAVDRANLTYEVCSLPQTLKRKCLSLMSELGLVFGGMDFVIGPDGEYVFLEINPSGQWGWIEYETGHKITDCIVELLLSPGR